MRPRSSSVLSGCLLAALLAVGCASAEADPAESDQADAITRGRTLTLEMTISESKVVYSSRLESFRVTSGAESAPCREAAFGLSSKPSLYDEGWAPEKAAEFSDSIAGATYRSYSLATCRDAGTEVLAWFGSERDIELSVGDQLLASDYDPARLPLLLRHTALGRQGEPGYYECKGAFQKTLVAESANAKRFDVRVSCTGRRAPTKKQLGPVDFLTNPGPFASVVTYKPWMLPAVEATPERFASVRAALLAKVAEGSYEGAMSTLAKKCGLAVRATEDALVVEHTIESSRRTRRLELKAGDLLGFVEGDLHHDPIRPDGPAEGTFAAAEFRDGKGGSVVVRFEQGAGLDDQVVRINGPEAYCRRLAKP